MKQKKLQLHGWWFDIAQPDVYCYETKLNQFVLIDEEEAQLITKRLGYSI
jgi:carbonic anhydrase